MKTIFQLYEKRKGILLPILGVLLVSIIALPYLILGEESYVQVHNQMDGEILNYICQAKYLFKSQTIPEFMNGMTKASMLPPAPLGVLFYLLLKPFQAFALMHLLILIIGFFGMYHILRKCSIKVEICAITAVLFCYMPFYPVYGLAILGQPLLIVCFWNLIEKKSKVWALAGIALYAGFSSLSLIGYAWIVFGVLFIIYLLIKKKGTLAREAAFGVVTLIVVYLLTNIELLTSMIGKSGFVTHREDMKLLPSENLLSTAKNLLLTGGSYAPVYGKVLFTATVLLLISIFLLVRMKKEDEKLKEKGKVITILLAAILVGTGLCTLWTSGFILGIRQSIGGGLAYFQADRIYWIFPFIWSLVLAFDLDGIIEMKNQIRPVFGKAILLALAGLLLLVQGYQIVKDNTLNKNARLMLVEGYSQITWKSLYMEDVFDEIKVAISKNENSQTVATLGTDLDSFSVVSLGLYPSVPLYNGFTCADGYSNNYSLDYKHQFRKIMNKELEKNEEAKRYFDEWGNRLYLVSSEYGFNSLLQKNQGYLFSSISIDTKAMKDLKIRYIFSAAPIEDADQLNLTLVSGSPFSSSTSYYEIWVYCIEEATSPLK